MTARGRGKSAASSHWAGHPALFYRGDHVTAHDHPGIWMVYGPSGSPGKYWLEPAEKKAAEIALRMPYGMLELEDSKMERWTASQSEGVQK